MIDNTELNELMKILEDCEDESLAVSLLKELNDATKEWGTLLMNKDQNLDHEEWKKKCDTAQERVNKVARQIRQTTE